MILLSVASLVIEVYFVWNGLDIAPIRVMCIYMIVPGALMGVIHAITGYSGVIPGTWLLVVNTAASVAILLL